MGKRPSLDEPIKRLGRKPREGIVHSSLYLPEAVHEALREAAFKERVKIHDIVLEGIGLALKARGSSSSLIAKLMRKSIP
jgi:hypothetical protein